MGRFIVISAAAAIAIITATVIGADSPTTAPATQPAGMALHGRVQVSPGWTLANPDLSRAVVFLAASPALDERSGPTTRATVSQYHKSFTPGFVVVPLGTEVEFPNWDHFDHNVFSRSAAAPAFDLDRYPYGKSKTRTFEKLGVVQIFCNIHPQMRAVIYVTPNRFFARPDADGNFAISGLPAGTFDVVLWHERCEEQRQTITLAEGEAPQINFVLKESRERAINSSDATARRSGYGGVERGLGVKRERLDLPVVTDSHPAPEESRP